MLDETKLNDEQRHWWNSLSQGTRLLLDALAPNDAPRRAKDIQTAGIIMPGEWPAIRDAMTAPRALVEHIVPAKAKTLLHGPPGVGKSGLLWSLGNAVTEGKYFLGLKTTKANCLLISVDMNPHELKQRWGSDFEPRFPFIAPQKFDLCDIEKFSRTPLFELVREHVWEQHTELVLIDATGGIHLGRTAIEDTTASLVDAALSFWLPDCAVLMLGHNHKQRRGADNKPVEPGPEDCLGSQLWSANATSQINVVKQGENVSLLRHEKSQVLPKLPDPIRVFMNKHGQVELYSEHKAASAVATLQAAEKALAQQLAPLKPGEQVKLLAQHLGMSRTKVYELRKLSKETQGGNTGVTPFQTINGIPIGQLSGIGQKTPGRASR